MHRAGSQVTRFDVLQRALERRRKAREVGRQEALRRVEHVLAGLAGRYGLREAYLFGSIVRPGRFDRDSDVDVAVADLGAGYWAFAAQLSAAVGREVDVVELRRSRFAARIRREGRRWTPKA